IASHAVNPALSSVMSRRSEVGWTVSSTTPVVTCPVETPSSATPLAAFVPPSSTMLPGPGRSRSAGALEPRASDRPAAGHGVVVVEQVGERSVVSRAYATSPLRLLMPRNHGHAAWVFTSTFGGGMVDGDGVDLSIEVAPEASAYVSTQASTKIY